MDGCTVKKEFAYDSKMTTSLGSKAHLENINKTLCFNYCATAPPKISIQHQKSKGKHLLLVFWDEVKLHLSNVSMLALARIGKLSL